MLVWLHGGSLTGGSGAVAVYDGAQLARRGLVVVTVNYRLGALGLLAHPGLSAESPRHVSGNYGLLDCIAALQWVRRNIAAFARSLPDTLAGEALRLYPFSNDEQAGLAQKQSMRDQGLFGTLRWARTRAARDHAPLYVYHFTRGIPWPEHPEFGAFHSSDVPYAFANLRLLDRPWQEVDRPLSETFAAYWVRFAGTGDPNGPGMQEWLAFDPGEPRLLELGTTVAPRPILEPRRVEFYEKCMALPPRE